MKLEEIKSAELTLKPNKLLLPVTQVTSLKDFNEIYKYWKNEELNGNITYGIPKTHSGGICIDPKIFKPPYYEISIDKNLGAELTVLSKYKDKPAYYRIQLRGVEKRKIMSGKVAFDKFKKELKKDGINIEDYYISTKEGLEIKKTIEKPRIEVIKQSYIDVVFENAHHIDIHNSYPSGMAEFIPEWRPTIERLYKQRKYKPENKQILNLTCGYFQSEKWFGAKLSHISKYAIHRNNEKIEEKLKWLEETGRMPVLINTDGIWFVGESTNLHSKDLGEFEEDHTNCKLRIKSDGAYEFIEDGVYHPVIRGRTTLETTKPRNTWAWGDIYDKQAEPKLLKFDETKGIIEV